MTVAEILSKHGIKLANALPGRHYTTCPQCSAKRSKAHQAEKVLGVTVEADGGVRWGCNHCSWTGPPKGSGGERPELLSYIYRDADGAERFRKVRNAPGREPRFWLERANGHGKWLKGTKGVDTKIVYRLDEVRKAIAEGLVVAAVEGEKDADSLWRIGIAATCNAHGASEPGKRPKWIKAHSEQIAGADLVVLNDHDPPAMSTPTPPASCRMASPSACGASISQSTGRACRRAATSPTGSPPGIRRRAAGADRGRTGLCAGRGGRRRQARR